METPTQKISNTKKTLFVAAGIVAAIVALLLATQGRWLKTNLLTVDSVPITVSTDQNNYTAMRGTVMPVTFKVSGNSEKQPILGMKLTLTGVPSYARLESSSIEIPAGVEVDQAIVNNYNDYRIILLYGMHIKNEGDVFKLNFKIDNAQLPKTPVRVNVFNETGSGAQLVSEIATLNSSNEYVSYTINSGTAFTILPTDATPTATTTPSTAVNGNDNINGHGSAGSPSPSAVGNANDNMNSGSVGFGGQKNVGNLPVYDPTGAGSNRLIVQSVEALSTNRSSTVAVHWQPVITVKPVQYDIYRAKYKNCGGTATGCYQSSDFLKVASVVDSTVTVDATAQPGQQYIYAVQTVIDGAKSLLSSPSATVATGNDVGGYRDPSLVCVPYSSKFPIHLSSQMTGTGAVLWTSSNTDLVTVQNGTVQVASTANAKGGIAMINSTANDSSTTNVIFVTPRGDTKCGGTVGAIDANNVANGWGIGDGGN